MSNPLPINLSMSIIQVRDLPSLPKKTLIYFSNTLPIKTLKESYTYSVSVPFATMVQDLSSLLILNFPIICYDDGDMNWASTAFCIFKAMHLSVLVLYGGLKSCEDEGLDLIPYSAFPLPTCSPSPIDTSLLDSTLSSTFSVKCLPFSIYEVLGRDISVDKLKKLLETHGVQINTQKQVLSGPSAAILALLTVYFGGDFPTVYLGDWKIEVKTEGLNAETFYSLGAETFHSLAGQTFVSVAESAYYDAIEDEPTDQIPSHSPSVVVEHYKVPNIPVNRTSVDYRIESSETVHCKRCALF